MWHWREGRLGLSYNTEVEHLREEVSRLRSQLQETEGAVADSSAHLIEPPPHLHLSEPRLAPRPHRMVGSAAGLMWRSDREMAPFPEARRSIEQELWFNEGGQWKEVYVYVTKSAASEVTREDGLIRDRGRGGMRLQDFAELPEATGAALSLAEVAILRCFTGGLDQVWTEWLLATRDERETLEDWSTCCAPRPPPPPTT